jgi:hypothetical protein
VAARFEPLQHIQQIKYHHNLTQRCKNVNISLQARFFSNHHINTASFYIPQAHFDWLRYSMAHTDDLPLHILTADSQTWNSNNISAFFKTKFKNSLK